jgi:hypothetical protein
MSDHVLIKIPFNEYINMINNNCPFIKEVDMYLNQYKFNRLCKALYHNNIVSEVYLKLRYKTKLDFLCCLIEENNYIKIIRIKYKKHIPNKIYKLVPYLIGNRNLKCLVDLPFRYYPMTTFPSFLCIIKRNKSLKHINRLLHVISACKDKTLCRYIIHKILDWIYKIKYQEYVDEYQDKQ